MTEAEERAYVTRLAMWLLVVGGYRIEEQFVKGEQIITGGSAPAVSEPPALWVIPSGAGVIRMSVTRLVVRERPVTVVGAVNYEPGMVRVRTADGVVHRALREHVTLIDAVPAADVPEYVIRIDLDGPYADLTWDTKSWSVAVCADADADADPELSQTLTDQADTQPDELLRLARPVLDEAARRWGNPRWTLTEQGRHAVEDLTGDDAMSFAEVKAAAHGGGVW